MPPKNDKQLGALIQRIEKIEQFQDSCEKELLELNLTVQDNQKRHNELRHEFDNSNSLTTFDKNIKSHLTQPTPSTYSQFQDQLTKFTADYKSVEKKLQKQILSTLQYSKARYESLQE